MHYYGSALENALRAADGKKNEKMVREQILYQWLWDLKRSFRDPMGAR